MEGVAASVSVLAFWLAVGIVYWYFQRQKKRKRQREAEIERLMQQWVERQRTEGIEAHNILEQMPVKRAQIEAMLENQ